MAAGRGGRGHRARGLLQRQADPRARARSSATATLREGIRDRGRPLPRDRHPAVAARRDARLPEQRVERRPRGLKPAQAWLEVVKWQALAARQVAQELHFSTIWSWGWTSYDGQRGSRLRPRPRACGSGRAHLALQRARAAQARAGTRRSTEGQLVFPRGAQCIVGKDRIVAVVDLAARDADRRPRARVQRAVRAHDRVAARARHARGGARGGARADRRPLRRHRARRTARRSRGRTSRSPSRGRSSPTSCGARSSRERHAHVRRADGGAGRRPSTSRTRTCSSAQVKAKPAPSWLGGKTKGYALEVVAPSSVFRLGARGETRRSGRSRASSRCVRWARRSRSGRCRSRSSRPAIRVALDSFAQGDAFEEWTTKVQTAALATTICRGDDLPAPGPSSSRRSCPFLLGRRVPRSS